MDVAPTLTDQVGFNVYTHDRPRVRRKRIMVAVAALLIGPVPGLVLGFPVGWATDAHGLLISVRLGGVAGLLHLCRRPILRRRIRGSLAERPGVDRADPKLQSRFASGSASEGSWSMGVCAASDLMALGAIRALRRAGLLVRHDVSVVGYDDILLGRLSTPALTTVRQNTVGGGRRLVNSVLQPATASYPEPLRAELVVRESCGG